MPNLHSKPEDIVRGSRTIPADFLNFLVHAMPRIITGGRGIAVKMLGDRVVVEQTDSPRPNPPRNILKLFEVVEVKQDYVRCRVYTEGAEPDPDAAVVAVAKPRLLQYKRWNGKTVDYGDDGSGSTPVDTSKILYTYTGLQTRTAKVGTGTNAITEKQVVTPPYFKSDVITARHGTTGLVDPDTLDDNGNPVAVVWEDLNCGGRAWAVQWDQTPVYDNPS